MASPFHHHAPRVTQKKKMWTVGGEDDNDENSFSGRKMRPVAPNNHEGNEFFSHHLLGEQKKRREQVVASTRWNPTAEQVRALEELYRRGTRTPSAEQIQHITAHLTRFGKIEGKNVFYWFQNHKARERQKRRRHSHALDKKDLAASRAVVEVEETKNWAPSTANCTSTLLAKESVSMPRRTATAGGGAERRPDGWLQLSEGELLHQQQQRRNSNIVIMERNATWHNMVHLSSLPPNNAINYMPTTTLTRTMLDPELAKPHDLSFFISTQRDQKGLIAAVDEDEDEDYRHNNVDSQTLQLFPLRSGADDSNVGDKETSISASPALINAANNLTPRSQFFEFLPLKD